MTEEHSLSGLKRSLKRKQRRFYRSRFVQFEENFARQEEKQVMTNNNNNNQQQAQKERKKNETEDTRTLVWSFLLDS